MQYAPATDPCPLPFSPFKACTVPRPIGWLSTISKGGVHNLAPYSQWQNLTFDPPMVMFAANQYSDGRRKHTVINAEETYVNTAHPDLLKGSQAMAMVEEKFHPKPQVAVDPKTGKPLPPSQQPSPAAAALKEDTSGFFGGFFASKNKKRLQQMEAPPPVLRALGTMTEREQMETEVIKLLILSYFSIVQRTVTDLVPKAIMLKLIIRSKDEIQKELLQNLYSAPDLPELVRENENTVLKRQECVKMIEVLRNASEIVSSV